MDDHTDLIAALRSSSVPAFKSAADVIEAQAARIRELEAPVVMCDPPLTDLPCPLEYNCFGIDCDTCDGSGRIQVPSLIPGQVNP